MRKLFKKILVVSLGLFMIMSLYIPAHASETGSIQGDTVLLAPPVGVKSQVRYSLLNANSEAVGNAVYSITPHDGVSVDAATGILTLNGTNIKNGTFTLSASNGEVEASTTVKISDARYFLDFQNCTPGEQARTVFPKKLSDGSELANISNGSALVADEGGNYYVQSSGWTAYAQFRPEYATIDYKSPKLVTMSARIKIPGSSTYGIKANNAGVAGGEIALRVNNYALLEKSGGAADYSATSGTFIAGQWNDFHVVLNYSEYTYSVYINNALVINNYQMNNHDNSYLGAPYFETYLDDLSFYSGAPLLQQPGSIKGDVKLLAPPRGVKSNVKYTLLNASSEPVTGAEFKITPLAGVSVNPSTGVVTLDGTSITSGTFTITAENDLVKASKTVTIPDMRIFSDLEDETVGNQAMVRAEKLDGTKIMSNLNNQASALIAEESSGNKYASPSTYLLLNPDWSGVDANHKTVTLSYRTMVTSNSDKGFKENSDSSVLLRSSAYVLTARYGTDTGYTATSGRFKPNDWTDMRIVCDYYDRVFSVYLDDELIINRQPMYAGGSTGYFKKFYVESAIDDFAMYSGELADEDYIMVDGVKYDGTSTVLTGENHTVTAHICGTTVQPEERTLIVAHYVDNMLKGIATITKSHNGKYAFNATLGNIAGGTVKVMQWNMNTLEPLAEVKSVK